MLPISSAAIRRRSWPGPGLRSGSSGLCPEITAQSCLRLNILYIKTASRATGTALLVCFVAFYGVPSGCRWRRRTASCGQFQLRQREPFALPLEFSSCRSTCLLYNRDNIGHYLQKDSSPVDLTDRCSRTGPQAVAGLIAILRLRDFFGIFLARGSFVEALLD